jgi:hypothetical protein
VTAVSICRTMSRPSLLVRLPMNFSSAMATVTVTVTAIAGQGVV